MVFRLALMLYMMAGVDAAFSHWLFKPTGEYMQTFYDLAPLADVFVALSTATAYHYNIYAVTRPVPLTDLSEVYDGNNSDLWWILSMNYFELMVFAGMLGGQWLEVYLQYFSGETQLTMRHFMFPTIHWRLRYDLNTITPWDILSEFQSMTVPRLFRFGFNFSDYCPYESNSLSLPYLVVKKGYTYLNVLLSMVRELFAEHPAMTQDAKVHLLFGYVVDAYSKPWQRGPWLDFNQIYLILLNEAINSPHVIA